MAPACITNFRNRALVRFAILLCLSVLAGCAQPHAITVVSTTSTEQSGLFGYILPRFTAATAVQVKVVAVGTGQALDIGRRGDADVVFVHDRAAEQKFIADGEGLRRYPVMYNDFVLIGPSSDPAHARDSNDILQALRKIATVAACVSEGV